jgi:lipopolysaccharide/colanic/teichoic acid biosynthesis glycosyltransferase
MIAGFSPWLQKWFRRTFVAAADNIHSPAQMQRVLHRERARTERTGEALAVVVFTPSQPHVCRESLALLARTLRRRLRVTDDAGWMDELSVAAVLPGTKAAGAWTVARAICDHLPVELMPLLCTVYCTPLPRSDGDAPASWEGMDESSQRVLALDMLFLQRLPLWKRALDVTGALLGLLVLLPLFVLIALVIKVTSTGPIFFRQWRSGHGGRPFLILKFRTMVADAEVRKQELLMRNERDGPAFKIRDDPRITTVGAILRTTSLDELPQLWNILKGDMSLVGPRPLPCEESRGCEVWHRRRLDVMPGLTCIWQVRGRSQVPFAAWMRMDVEYICNQSLWQDLKLLFLTVPAVLWRRGAH